MTNATDALRDVVDLLIGSARDDERNGLPDMSALTLQLRGRILATPAGSASGEVPFAVVGGVEFDSPQALCAAHADLQAEVALLTDGPNTAVSALHIALDRAETAEAALAEARRVIERCRDNIERRHEVSQHNPYTAREVYPALFAAIDAAMGSANGQG